MPIGIVGVYWGAFASREPSAAGAAVRQLFDWLAEGKLRPEISGRYELANAPQALRAMLDRKVTGKVVVLPEA